VLVLTSLSHRLLPILQLTRMALVFTAISNSLCTLLIWTQWQTGSWRTLLSEPERILAVVMISAGLYGFGMSLNDIIDRRRDAQIAAHRPLPSGRVGVITAHVICILLGLMALVAGAYYAHVTVGGWRSLALVILTGLLIAFYDFAGKYLVAMGLVSLGLIRFAHACIPAPQLTMLWHPLLLLNHVAIISAVAYRWEEKRPALGRIHWWGVAAGLGLLDLVLVGLVWWTRRSRLGADAGLAEILRLDRALLLPAGLAIMFVGLAILLRLRCSSPRVAGQSLMLYGLLWLILYDAAFVAMYVAPLPAGALLVLLPVAYLSVQAMRWWSKFLSLSQRPSFKRAEV
jgi:4-hydroxybenzoate polyprenyltransferase